MSDDSPPINGKIQWTLDKKKRKFPLWPIIFVMGCIIVVLVTLGVIYEDTYINGMVIRVQRCDNNNYSINGISIDVYNNGVKITPQQITTTREQYHINLGGEKHINKIVINNLLSNPASILGCQITVIDGAGKAVILKRFSENAILPIDRVTAIAFAEEKKTEANNATGAAKVTAMMAKHRAMETVMKVTAIWMADVAQKSPAATKAAATQAAAEWATAATKASEYVAMQTSATVAQLSEAGVQWERAMTSAYLSRGYLEAAAADATKARDAAIAIYTKAQSEKATEKANTPAMAFATTRAEKAMTAKQAWELAVTKANEAVVAATAYAASTPPSEALMSDTHKKGVLAHAVTILAIEATRMVPDTAPATFTLTATRNILRTNYRYNLN
jgi:hypothetical protein